MLSKATKTLGLAGAASLTFFSLLAAIATPAVSANLGAIQGTKFNDLDKDGVRDPLELGLAGWTIELLNFEGQVIQTATTNLSGAYQFTNLAPGPYVVREVAKAGWKQTLPNFQKSLQLGQVLGPWDYSDPDAQWPTIAPDASGSFQSPVNITETPSIDLGQYLDINYTGFNTKEIKNSGYGFDVAYYPGIQNSVEVAGQRFDLQQFHFHYESEHAVDGDLSEMEVHFVNRHAQGGLTVLGFLIEEGTIDNPVLDPVFDAIQAQLDANGEVPSTLSFTQSLNLASLFSGDLDGWFYNGSLTTPPATEGVNWFVFENPIKLSTAQIQTYKDFLESIELTHNNRPLQDLNGRQFNELNHQEVINGGTISGVNFGGHLHLGILGLSERPYIYEVTVPESGALFSAIDFGVTPDTDPAAVPEPFTILGATVAIGFGAKFKQRLGKKKG